MKSNGAIQLVVFDMAGTTVRDDDAVNHCLRGALAAAAVHVSRDETNDVMGIPKPLAIQALYARKHRGIQPSAEITQRIYEDFLTRMVLFYQKDPAVEEMPGASDVFRKLHDCGVKVALDSGFARPIVDTLLERLGWLKAGLLDTTVSSDEVPRGRPEPDLVLEAMRRTGVHDAAAVAKVGDTPSDLQEGKAAGCSLIIGITHGTHTAQQLQAHPHTHLIASLQEVPALVLRA